MVACSSDDVFNLLDRPRILRGAGDGKGDGESGSEGGRSKGCEGERGGETVPPRATGTPPKLEEASGEMRGRPTCTEAGVAGHSKWDAQGGVGGRPKCAPSIRARRRLEPVRLGRQRHG
eukprot:3075362-Pleurochrysis_carterae.AAC.1